LSIEQIVDLFDWANYPDFAMPRSCRQEQSAQRVKTWDTWDLMQPLGHGECRCFDGAKPYTVLSFDSEVALRSLHRVAIQAFGVSYANRGDRI
jgi:hypothetical protein